LHFPLREQLFIGWVGLRGAVPIFLAIIPVISPGPVTVQFFNEVFIVVIASLVLQGWTISIAARVLDVEAPPEVPYNKSLLGCGSSSYRDTLENLQRALGDRFHGTQRFAATAGYWQQNPQLPVGFVHHGAHRGVTANDLSGQ
jgi:hypothetical protein